MSAFGEQFAKEMRDVLTDLTTQFDGRSGDNRMAILKQGDKTWNETKAEYEFGPDIKCFLTGVEKTVSESLVNGTTIRSGDKMLTVSVELVDESDNPIDYVPQVNDKVLIDGSQWSIVGTPHIDYSGAGLIVGYKMQVRK